MVGVKRQLAGVRSTELRRDSDGVVRHGSEWLQLWANPDSLRSAEARARALEAARRAARAEHALAATLRAMAGAADITVRFADSDAALTGRQVVLPALRAAAVSRGAADRIGARLRHHHAALAPAPPRPWPDLFDALEQARCEALAARHMPGVPGNLAAYAAWRLERMGFAHARLPADLPLAEALSAVMRGVLTGGDLALDATALHVWDRWIRTRLAADCASLVAAVDDQGAFAVAADAFIAALLRSIGRAATDTSAPAPALPDADGDTTPGEAATHVPRTQEFADSADDVADTAPPPRPALVAARPPAYAAYTTAHDRVVSPADLCGAAELAALRARLDGETGGMRSLLSRLAAQLQRRLLARQHSLWQFDCDEGLLDAARLDRVVTTPGAALAFKRERQSAFHDTVVTLLIDCSGSMRGRSILLAAIAADVTARALERGGVACEVLGFTTADFTGGRSAADWARAGRALHPGRLGDLRHIVIKPADTGYRAARANFGLLLKPDLLRENVDGEALAWAHRRLLARREQRRVLVAISDGAPSEAATGRANPAGLLERHLADAIAGITQVGKVELRAIGIRHDVRHLYRDAVTISDAQMVGPALIAQLGAVFASGRRHARQP